MELLPTYATEIGILVCAFIGIAFSLILLRDGEPPNMDECRRITGYVSRGVTTFLAMEWRFVAIFMVVFVMVIFPLPGFFERFSSHSRPRDFAIGVSFLLGALTSAFSSFLGMKVALYASAWTGLRNRNGSFNAAFWNGAAMGFLLAANSLLGLYIAIIMLKRYYGNDWEGLFEAITSYGLGASSMAFFGRTGGGIYAKAADVCHCLVNKYLSEDLPRRDQRPTVITYDVGYIVGDVAGMGTDLVGAALIAASISSSGIENNFTAMCYPLLISSMGILVCLITTLFFPKIKNKKDEKATLEKQLIISTILMSGGIVILNWIALPSLFKIDESGKDMKNWQLSLCVGVGLWAGLGVRLCPIHHPRYATRVPRDDIANGPAGNLLPGFGVLRGIFIPVYALISIGVSLCFADTYGIALAALGMLSTIPTRLAIDACDPIGLYADHITKMALREDLDMETLPATEKGFAMESTALVSVALFVAFAGRAKLHFAFWDIQKLKATISFFSGYLLPLVFSCMTMRSVGRAGLKMALEYQNRRARLNMELESQNRRADYIEFPTVEFLWGLIGPGALVMLTPVIVGTFFGADALFGVLAGSLFSVLLIAVSPSDADGALNIANKSIRAGASEYASNPLFREPNFQRAVDQNDTVGNPRKDTSGPPLNILVQLMALESLVFASFFASHGGLPLKPLPAGGPGDLP